MKSLFAIFILIYSAICQMKYLSYSQNVNRIEPNKVLEISNQVGGFYRRTSTTILKNGKIAVLDIGNHEVKIFSDKAKFLLSFGKTGQGPGEFCGLDKIYSINNNLFIRSNYKLSFFDDTGQHLRDVRLLVNGQVGNPVIYNHRVYIFFEGNSILSHIILNEKGIALDRIKNKTYLKNGIKEDDTVLLSSSIRVLQMGEFIYKAAYGLFDLKKYNSDFELLAEYGLDMDPVKRNPQKIIDNMLFDANLKGKALAKAKQYELNLILKEISIYENGIKSLIGMHKGKMLIQISTKDRNEVYILLIQGSIITDKIVISNTHATELRLERGRLIVNSKDSLNGPEIKIYEIK